METFGEIILAALTVIFLLFSINCIIHVLLDFDLDPTKWECTNSIVVSQPNKKPVKEECSQYSLIK